LAEARTVVERAADRPAPAAAEVEARSSRLGEPRELLERRLEALETYLATPLPPRSRHLWRYTDPASVIPPDLARGPAALPDLAEEGLAAAVVSTGEGPVVRMGDAGRAAGLEIASGDHRAAASLLGTVVPAEHGLLEALSLAAFDALVVVRVPAGVHLETPVRVAVPAAAGTSLPRLVVVAEEGAELTVIEEHLGGGEGSHVVGVTEIVAGAGARVRHALVERWAAGTVGHLTSRGRLERGAALVTALATLGGARAKLDVGAVLAGREAESELYGVVLGEARQHLDHHTVHHHVAPATRSTIDLRVVLTGRARSAYTGLIRIEDGAGGAEAYQENRNLLLSETCRAETIPELEILTEDVRCTHGATVAPLDGEQVFYLESRGLDRPAAERLIVRGFLDATLSRVPGAARRDLEAMVEERLARFRGGHL